VATKAAAKEGSNGRREGGHALFAIRDGAQAWLLAGLPVAQPHLPPPLPISYLTSGTCGREQGLVRNACPSLADSGAPIPPACTNGLPPIGARLTPLMWTEPCSNSAPAATISPASGRRDVTFHINLVSYSAKGRRMALGTWRRVTRTRITAPHLRLDISCVKCHYFTAPLAPSPPLLPAAIFAITV